MSLAALRALVLQVNVAAHGMPVTVTVPNGEPVSTDGIWFTPETDGDAQKHGTFVLVLRKADVPSVPRKTIVIGSPPNGDQTRRWMVDSTMKVETDRVYVVLVPAPED